MEGYAVERLRTCRRREANGARGALWIAHARSRQQVANETRRVQWSGPIQWLRRELNTGRGAQWAALPAVHTTLAALTAVAQRLCCERTSGGVGCTVVRYLFGV